MYDYCVTSVGPDTACKSIHKAWNKQYEIYSQSVDGICIEKHSSKSLNLFIVNFANIRLRS
jgi:predicted component of viral defense system (DUF524 family)